MKILASISICILLSCSAGELNENTDPIHFEVGDSLNQENEILTFDTERISSNPDLSGVEFKGSLVHAYSWQDQRGENILVQSILNSEASKYPSSYLFSRHYIKKGDSLELFREVQDKIENCEFDITLKFLTAPIITDLNSDEIAEVTTSYLLTCRSDVSEAEMKVIMYDQNGKYALRGAEYIIFPDYPPAENMEFDLSKFINNGSEPEWLEYRGRYENSFDFKSAPLSFLSHADSVWRANVFRNYE